MSGRFFHALWQSIAAPLLMVGSRLLRSTMRDQRRRAPASALSQRHDSSRDDASGRLRESAPRQSRLTGRSRTTLWDAEPEGWVGEQEDGPTCLTSCLGKIPRFHIRVKQESQNVGLEIASAVEVSAERRLTGRVRAEMTVSVVAPGTADAADARGRQSRESQRIPNSKRPTRGPIRDADAAAAFLRVAANGGCRGEPERRRSVRADNGNHQSGRAGVPGVPAIGDGTRDRTSRRARWSSDRSVSRIGASELRPVQESSLT